MNKSERLGLDNVGKLLLNFSIPAIIGMLVNALYNIVDRIYIGNISNGIGAKALAGVGITLPIATIIMAFGMLVGIGSSTLISIKLGENNKEYAEEILGQALILDIIISIFISIVGLIFLTPLLKLFGAEGDNLFYAKEYIAIILGGSIFQNLGFGINNIIRSEGNPKIAMRTMIVGALLNIILDPIFIFDSIFNLKIGLGLGIKGAAIATIISSAVNTILVLHYFISKNSGSTLKFRKRHLKLTFKTSVDIFAIGLSPFAMQIANSIVVALYNKGLLTYGGNDAVAAMSIITSISTIIFMPIFGINQGVQPILGYNYGAKLFSRVKKAIKLAIISGIALASIGFIAVEFFPDILFSAFAKDAPNLIKLGSHGIRIDLILLPLVGYQIVTSNYFQAIGKAKISIFLSFLRQVIVLIPLICILPKFLQLDGIWLSQPIADIAATLITSYFFIRDIKLINKTEHSYIEE
ncbi:MATE family efflux transporter [Clostridium botulinum]|uniref:Multidrug export protein MepA n=2 Tax=Clostridium botulinum TaxID=1491 RepID=A0A9Q1V1L6_CLOBO|nr:MATE family efflux transporter [Clostridium botulinum]KEI02939.1 multidrug transporter MatE [Clostridium botulinum D str. 16868]KEI03052.1 multidrug transporter MatE [Clostridium botulinum C/D str. Sp77]KLU76178.1 multidrug transporter MatE [Clostridium botulinum V891]KOA73062.1 multidrug transporter MatE [Clostridium botulinum]KOA79342.1 multidrug transporter MatE [Clostridium botulinum]